MSNARVLIVDDDFHVATLHSNYVQAVPGFSVVGHAGNAQQALQAFHSLRPDLVLLDVYLPDGSGLDVLRQLDCDVMMLSAAADALSLRMAFRRGALAYLLKPFGGEELAQRLRAYARYRRLLEKTTGLDQEAVERARRALLSSDGPAVSSPARTRSGSRSCCRSTRRLRTSSALSAASTTPRPRCMTRVIRCCRRAGCLRVA